MNLAVAKKQFRRFPRRSFGRRVGFLFQGSYQIFNSYEIGEGGISLYINGYVKERIDLEKEAVLSFLVPGADFIVIRAIIKNISTDAEETRVGFQFDTLHPVQVRMIRYFVGRR